VIMSEQFTTLGVTTDGPIGHITFQRPERANAINDTLLSELDVALEQLIDDDTVRVVVLRGAGKGFSAGHDRREPMMGIDDDDHAEQSSAEIMRSQYKMSVLLGHVDRIWQYPKPTIASVHGYCIGVATQIAACCDLTVVAEDAEIGLASIPTGAGFLAPAWALFAGIKRAKQLALDYGSRIDGSTAVSWGWANFAVPAEELDQATTALATRIARAPSDLLAGQKVAINRVAETAGFRAAMAGGVEIDLLVATSPETKRQRQAVREQGLRATMDEFRNSSSVVRGS
jgi:enoyl-CoA hydratase